MTTIMSQTHMIIAHPWRSQHLVLLLILLKTMVTETTMVVTTIQST